MRVAVFSTKPYDVEFLTAANGGPDGPRHELTFLEARLDETTTPLADGFPVVSVFVNDSVDAAVVERLATGGTRLLALRSAGFNHVDVEAAHAAGMTVARVPAYSPYAVAEHAVALVLALNRHIPRAYNRVRDGNFALHGLLGFDVHGRTAGVIGTGMIGQIFARIMAGFGCRVLAYDPYPTDTLDGVASYVSLAELFAQSDIVSLHCPLTPQTHHIIDAAAVEQMKPGVTLVNTSRGALVDTAAVIDGLKSGRIGYLGLDVYEEEERLFFEDMSARVITDDVFTRLLTFPNVLITGHQAFFTREAVEAIAATTIDSISAFAAGTQIDRTRLVLPAG